MSDPRPKAPAASPLMRELQLLIETQGPLSLSRYMQLCLTHPQHGYYRSRDPLGSAGDFVTAPEISQLFGEMIGIWVLIQWRILGQPEHFDLVELGPGRGTLLTDALRVIAKEPDAFAAMHLVLLETNPELIELQRRTLARHPDLDRERIRWIREIEQLGDHPHPLIVIANEFFDALPIVQLQYQRGNWHERLVGMDGNRLVWGLSPSPVAPKDLPAPFNAPENAGNSPDIDENAIIEFSPLARATMARLAHTLNRRGGALIAIDYGYATPRTGETLQAVADHTFADPLTRPGEQDLSAHVDFHALLEQARQAGIDAHMAGTQGQVLRELGIMQRAESLMKSNPDKAQEILAGLKRLVETDQMGDLFKVLVAFVPPPSPFRMAPDLDRHPAIAHGFFGRKGGVSPAPYDSLNVSVNVGDTEHNTLANRARAARALGLDPNRVYSLKQIHSTRVLTITPDMDATKRPEADGMVTSAPDVGLGVLSADCTPILFADPHNRVIGACHAGWRGAVSGIIEATLAAMEELGGRRNTILAAIGPTIWQENYEVDERWVEDFLARHPDGEPFIAPMGPGTPHFDLPGFIESRLRHAGIAGFSRIGGCTYAQPETYFSHRFATHANALTGRQISIISQRQESR